MSCVGTLGSSEAQRKPAQPTIANVQVEQVHWGVRQRADHQERSALGAGVATLDHTVLGGQYVPAGLSTATARSSETLNSFPSPSSLKRW